MGSMMRPMGLGYSRASGGPGRDGRVRLGWPLRGLTPWAEEADTDPDPEPYITHRRKTATQERIEGGYGPYAWPTPEERRAAAAATAPHAPDTARKLSVAPAPGHGGGGGLLAAVSRGPGWLLRGLLGHLALPALAGGVVGYGLGLAPLELGMAAALGVLGRAAVRALAETVPFTGRRHHLLLPLPLELMMGEASFRRFLAEQRAQGKVLSRRSRDHLLVAEVANSVIAAAARGHGGGSQRHMQRFKWEVVTIDDDTANAFVLPGGKVVVYTGLLRLLGRRRDLLATVLGHEVAHAMARHSAEKMTLGILAAIALRVLVAAGARAAAEAQQQQQQQQGGTPEARAEAARRARREREAYDTTRVTKGWPTPGGGSGGGGGDAGGDADSDAGGDDDYSLGPGSLVSQLLGAGGGSAAEAAREYARHASEAAYGYGGGPGCLRPERLDPSHPLMSPQVVELLNNLLLQLPFSRRAEAEADLIGLKLMALAGYDPALAPETFRLLEQAEHGGHGGRRLAAIASPVAKAASLGCTHPRSANRVRALEEEVRAMLEAGPEGYERVYTHPGYWSL
ncbi:hypothetical protein GPECTOR_7g1014 [Gonium pectorale]|uniref:Peptidase M48 domain-containing protein n=1 Tax=Gonium pectorale TaxID=33097 RepID=A0A150GTL7_GONPE|nr:hypothetical protein GPECTOR_7g1014 [Gonium pectorale]|eukprot:KXZ53123.1 hypothetical protein GPECTOR_7g1014 [Gonium pectorale]